MIKRIGENYTYSNIDLFSVRIIGLINAYGTSYPFAQFWTQEINDKTTALISKLDEYITLSYTGDCDIDELTQFVYAVGFDTLLCDSKFILDNEFICGIIMKCVPNSKFDIDFAVDKNPKLQQIFDLNIEEIGKDNFISWYTDFNHRIRHGASKAYLIDDIACGIVSSITDRAVAVSAIKTKAAFRHKGYGGAIVKSIINDFTVPIFLMREKDKNEKFYKKLDFENIDEWRIYFR